MKVKNILLAFVLAAATFIILDFLWFTLVTGGGFLQMLRPIANAGSIGEAAKISFMAAGIVYALLSVGVIFLVKPYDQKHIKDAALDGALYGLVVYGLYNFTNGATLEHWQIEIMAVDVIWGAFTSCLVSIMLYKVCKLLHR